MKPSSHIIIVNYNAGDCLSEAVSSSLQHSDSRISVVDNASVDHSMELAKNNNPSDRVEWIINAENLGFAAANNQVLKGVKADFTILMNPDCELKAGSLDAIFKAFADNPKFGLASCRILNKDHTLQATCRRRFPTPLSALARMTGLAKLFKNNPKFSNFDYGDSVEDSGPAYPVEAISGAFMVVRQQALIEVGLLDEGYFMHCEDLDWCKRFELAGWQVGFVPEAEVVHVKGVSSKSRPLRVLWTLHKGMNRFFDKFYKDTYVWPIRYAVKAGIVTSFVLRALLTTIQSRFGS